MRLGNNALQACFASFTSSAQRYAERWVRVNH